MSFKISSLLHVVVIPCASAEILTHIYSSQSLVSIYNKTEKTFKNEQRSKDAAAKKRPNTSGVGKINNYYEDIYIPPYNNTD